MSVFQLTLACLYTTSGVSNSGDCERLDEKPNDTTRIIAGYIEIRSAASRMKDWSDFTVVLGYSFCVVAFDDWCSL